MWPVVIQQTRRSQKKPVTVAERACRAVRDSGVQRPARGDLWSWGGGGQAHAFITVKVSKEVRHDVAPLHLDIRAQTNDHKKHERKKFCRGPRGLCGNDG